MTKELENVEKDNTIQLKKLDRLSSKFQNELAQSIAQKECMIQQKKVEKGSYESQFDDYIKNQMKVINEKYFGGDAMVGNVEHKFHDEILSGNYGFLNCLNDRPAIKMKYKKIWDILSKAKKGFSTKNATKEQLEETAKICEQFTEVYPLLFPQNNITRKMHCLSIVAPKQIREQGAVYKMLKIEQQGEKLHMD